MPMGSLLYIGILLIVVGLFWSGVNYIFHMPAYRPEWFDMQTMMRLIELNIAFTLLGTLIAIYAARSGAGNQ